MEGGYTIDLVIRINNGEEVANRRSYDQLVDYLNDLKTREDIQTERLTIEKAYRVMQLESFDEKWDYAEHELGGNILDERYKAFCWLDFKEFTPRLVLNYLTGELYLEYVLESSFSPRFKIDRQNLLKLLNDWETHITRC